jgi:serine/threonine-protein kinase
MEPTELLPPPDEPPPRRELWPWLLVLGLLVLAGLAAIWYATRDTGSAAAGQTTQLTTVQAAPVRPRTKPKKQTTTTSPAVSQVAVPDLVGRQRDDAIRTLEDAGLTASVAEVPSDQAKGLVVAQHPAGGTQVDKGSSVAFNVSKGKDKPPEPATVPVPNVVGDSRRSAERSIEDAGLHPSIQRVPSSQEKDTVVSQSPSGGTSAQRGAGVLINVSTGPAKTAKPSKTKPAKPRKQQQQTTATVPDVIGETETAATSDLQSAGFSVSSVDQPTNDPSMDGLVVDQSPPGGSDVDPDSTVTIYVGRYSTG